VSGTWSAWRRRHKRESLQRHLVYSAKARCDCGAGLAYDRRSRTIVWDCSAILLGDALFVAGERGACIHSTPCSYSEIVSETNPAARGASTRPVAA
jgi:hypothetical protein